MVGEGIIEISGERMTTARENIRKLKSILDGLRVMHIIDDIIFFSPCDEDRQMKAILKVRESEIEKNACVGLESRFGQSARFEYRKMIIPDLFKNNFTRLILLDDEEYKFLGDMLYTSEYGSVSG